MKFECSAWLPIQRKTLLTLAKSSILQSKGFKIILTFVCVHFELVEVVAGPPPPPPAPALPAPPAATSESMLVVDVVTTLLPPDMAARGGMAMGTPEDIRSKECPTMRSDAGATTDEMSEDAEC